MTAEHLRRAALVLGSVALTLLALEGGARLLFSPVTPQGTEYLNFMESLEMRRHPLLPFDGPRQMASTFYRYQPDSAWATAYPGNPRRYFDASNRVTYRMNAQGYRDVDFRRRPDPGVLRLAAIGDSFTFGEGVWLADTYPERLERLLGERGIPAECYNFGVNGYGIHDQMVILDEVLDYQPGIVVWGYLLNDIDRHRLTRLANELRTTKGRLPIFDTPSRLLSVLSARSWSWYTERRTIDLYRELYASPETWDEFTTLFSRAAARCRESGARLLVVVFPELKGLAAGTYPFDGIHAQLAAFFRTSGVPALDLAEPFRAAGPASLEVHPADAHPNERGHAIAARQIAATLDALGWTPRR